MSLIPFSSLPDRSRLLIYHAGRGLDNHQLETLHSALQNFLTGWTAHRVDLAAGYEIRHDQFVLIGVDEAVEAPSGCSLDALTSFLREAGRVIDVDFFSDNDICYFDDKTVRCVSRPAFGALASQGEINAATVVFNNVVPTVGDLRNGKWEVAAGESWHARAFDLKGADAA
jgi:hypothetical protein